MRLRSEGGIKALLGMVRCRHPDVLSQVARGIANFAKCESRASAQGKVHCECLYIGNHYCAMPIELIRNKHYPG